jgi:predicted metal-dependent HD superfamily phosphohydrolase
MATYGQPRRLNTVTVFMIFLGLAAGYWVWRFFPAYFDGFTVDHLLKEAASATYRLNRLGEPERSKELKALLDKMRTDIVKQANVTDPDLTVNLDIDGDKATLSADYNVVVTHAFVRYTTTLHFHKTETANIKKVNWE